jgi:hypothetical protein
MQIYGVLQLPKFWGWYQQNTATPLQQLLVDNLGPLLPFREPILEHHNLEHHLLTKHNDRNSKVKRKTH